MQVDDRRFPIEDILTKISGSKNEQSFKEAPPDAKSHQEILDWFADPKNKSKIKGGEWEVTRTMTDNNKITAVLDELEGRQVKQLKEESFESQSAGDQIISWEEDGYSSASMPPSNVHFGADTTTASNTDSRFV